jgi:hypothetical protein
LINLLSFMIAGGFGAIACPVAEFVLSFCNTDMRMDPPDAPDVGRSGVAQAPSMPS